MRTVSRWAAIAVVVCGAYDARAQKEVTLIAPGGIRAAIEQLIPGFEQKTGYKVKATFGSGLGTKRQVANGDAFDVPVVQPPYPEVLASGNHEEIRRWRRRTALEKTLRNRPDLLQRVVLSQEDKSLLAEIESQDI